MSGRDDPNPRLHVEPTERGTRADDPQLAPPVDEGEDLDVAEDTDALERDPDEARNREAAGHPPEPERAGPPPEQNESLRPITEDGEPPDGHRAD